VELVKGRECGECSVCCVVLNVDTKEFQKFPGIPCAHMCAKGCGIHETRFPICRTYHCGWRHMEFLGSEWRPDKSGVLIDLQVDDLPPHYPKRPGIRIMLVKPPEQVFNQAFFTFVARLVSAEVPVVLAVPGPPKHFPAGAFLNDILKSAVQKRDIAAVEAAFRAGLKGLETHQFNPVAHRFAANP